MDDDMVRKKYGNDGLEVFYAAKVMSQEVEATLPLAKEEFVRTMENLMESDEERRAREIMEGAVDRRPGHVEVHVSAAGGTQMVAETNLPKWAEEAVWPTEEVQLRSEHTDREEAAEKSEGDETDLMQRITTGYSEALNSLLRHLENMPPESRQKCRISGATPR